MSLVSLVGCSPVADPSVGLSVAEAVALIEQAPRSDLTPETVAEAFALGTRATNVQREMLDSKLIGRVIEWEFQVYDVELTDGRFTVTSRAIPIADADAVPLLRVMAYVLPQDEADDALLRAVKTDDLIQIRGIVQEIRLRTVVVIVPAVVITGRAHT